MTLNGHDNPLEGPPLAPGTGPELKRCAQCGRIGTHQFRTYPPGDFGGPSLTVCANKAACRKRWPKPSVDEAA
jgi:hypothetical protein